MIDFRSSTHPHSGTCASRYLIELSEARHLLVFGQFIFASIRTDVLFYRLLNVCARARDNNLREQILLSIIEIFAISCADNK